MNYVHFEQKKPTFSYIQNNLLKMVYIDIEGNIIKKNKVLKAEILSEEGNYELIYEKVNHKTRNYN